MTVQRVGRGGAAAVQMQPRGERSLGAPVGAGWVRGGGRPRGCSPPGAAPPRSPRPNGGVRPAARRRGCRGARAHGRSLGRRQVAHRGDRAGVSCLRRRGAHSPPYRSDTKARPLVCAWELANNDQFPINVSRRTGGEAGARPSASAWFAPSPKKALAAPQRHSMAWMISAMITASTPALRMQLCTQSRWCETPSSRTTHRL